MRLLLPTHRSNRIVVCCALWLLVACASTCWAQRPNILLLMAEDMSPRVGAFGDGVAVTPNLDRLAEEGVRYTQVFTSAGVCAPSRAAMILGQHQISTGTQHMRTASRPEGGYWAVPPPEVKAFPELLRREGYYTYTDRKLDYQFSGTFAGSGPFTIWDREDAVARQWNQRPAAQPFFGWHNFLITHESGVFTPLGNLPNSTTHLLMQLYRWWQFGSVGDAVDPENIALPPYYPDTETVRRDLARHYSNIAAMDRQVGEALAALKEDGLAESTIVIWTTDHGDGLPRAKRELFDSGIHVPMIVRWPERFRPKHIQPGTVDNRLISAVDFAPTILELAQVTRPAFLHGESFLHSERKYIFASRDRIDEIPDRQRAIRDRQFKYVLSWHPELAHGHELAFRDNVAMVREMRSLYDLGELSPAASQWFTPVGAERLFDLASDPHELKNLAGDPSYAPVLSRMRAALQSRLAEIGDLSEEPEERLVARFNTFPQQPRTRQPVVAIHDCQLSLTPATEGSSLAWRGAEQDWSVYTQPIDLCAQSIEVSAVRYGWQASEPLRVPRQTSAAVEH